MAHTRSWLTPTPPPKTCKTCRFYKNDETWLDCDCPKMVIGHGARTDDDDADGVRIEGGPVGTGISPGPDFGCIHHHEEA